jgi:hypothetical protein
MKKLRFVLLLIVTIYSTLTMAEGGCPPGSYPQVGQGWRACVPIPGDTSDESSHPAAEQWIDKWGALAVTDSGQINGQATNKATEFEAISSAIADCQAYEGQGCRKLGTYRNQCVAIAAGDTASRISVGKTEDLAVTNAMKDCSSDKLTGCHIYYSGCSLPQRIR